MEALSFRTVMGLCTSHRTTIIGGDLVRHLSSYNDANSFSIG
jgi:hypothetical protein